MKGDPNVIAQLKSLLQSEFTAMAQWRCDAQILRNEGFKDLKHKFHGFFYEENTHSKQLINRMLLIGGMPDPNNFMAAPPSIALDVVDIFSKELALETDAITRYNAAIKVADTASDNVTLDLLTEILEDENEHAEWLEKQLAIIRRVTKENYLADRIHER